MLERPVAPPLRRLRGARLLALAALASLALLAVPAAGAAQAADEGRTIFGQKCAGCHTIGGGRGVGPDLEDAAAKREAAWLRRFIAAPDEVIAAGDPIAADLLETYGAPMPNLGLSAAEVDALVAYLQEAAGVTPAVAPEPAPTAPAPAAPAAAGDADRGKRLFTGSDRLASGGTACRSCHTIAGIGALGGGTLGPDLTGAFAKYGGAAGVPGVLATLPFPTMTPLFQNRPLTAQEQADLAAFLERASTSARPGSAAWKLLLLALAGVAAAIGAGLLVWRRRSLSVRRQLVRVSTTRRG